MLGRELLGGVEARKWFAGLSGRRNGDDRGEPIESGDGL